MSSEVNIASVIVGSTLSRLVGTVQCCETDLNHAAVTGPLCRLHSKLLFFFWNCERSIGLTASCKFLDAVGKFELVQPCPVRCKISVSLSL